MAKKYSDGTSDTTNEAKVATYQNYINCHVPACEVESPMEDASEPMEEGE